MVPHRANLIIGQTFLHVSLYGRASVVASLRSSNEGLPSPRVARAQKIIRLHPSSALGAVGHTGFPNLSFSFLGGGLVESPTARNFLTRPPTGRYFSPALPSDCFVIDFPRRAIIPSEGLPILYTSMKGVAKAALYCAHRTSTFLSCAFCEQEGHLAAPFSFFSSRALRVHGNRPSYPTSCF